MTMRSSTHSGRNLRTAARRTWTPRSWVAVGHRSAGKTSLAEIVLHAGRVIRQPGAIASGTTLLDWSSEAIAHEQTLALSTAWIDIDDKPIVWVDTPGADALWHEQARAMHVADAVVLVVDSTKGIEHGTVRAVSALPSDRPCVVALTKADRSPSVERVWELADELSHALSRRVVPVQLPWVDNDKLIGIIDLFERIAIRYDSDRTGAWSPEPIPRALADVVWSATEAMAEAVALTDDALLEQYLEDLELPEDVVRTGLERAVAEGVVVPLGLTSAARGIGGEPLLATLGRFHPPSRPLMVQDPDGQKRPCDPADGFVATVVASQWDKAGKPLHLVRVCNGAPTRKGVRNSRTGEPVRIAKWYRLRGPRRAVVQQPGPGAWIACFDDVDLRPGDTLSQGVAVQLPSPDIGPVAWWIPDDEAPAGFRDELRQVAFADAALSIADTADGVRVSGHCDGHLALALERVEARLGVKVPTYWPPVPYRETPSQPVTGVVGLLRRTGEHGLVDAFGEVHVDVAPGDPNVRIDVEDAVTDEEALPTKFRPAVREGFGPALAHGPRGFPVAGVAVTLRHGEYDILSSTEAHLAEAATLALRRALEQAGTEVLEPVHDVVIEVPNEATGDVLAELAAHRGRVQGLATEGETTTIEAQCPYRELRTFPGRLTGLTGGRGRLRTELSHHRKVDMALVTTQREPCRTPR